MGNPIHVLHGDFMEPEEVGVVVINAGDMVEADFTDGLAHMVVVGFELRGVFWVFGVGIKVWEAFEAMHIDYVILACHACFITGLLE